MSFVWPTSHVGMLHPFAAIGSKAWNQGISFLRMAEAAHNGLSYNDTKKLFPGVAQSTVETRKSLYEELGLLYVPKYSGTIHLTEVGAQFFALLGAQPTENPSADLCKQVDSLLCWAMTHTQINRPQSLGSPSITPEDRANCDIRPYAAFWLAMFELGGSISFDEFSQVLAHVQRVSDFPFAVQVILEARKSGVLPPAPGKTGNFGIYWKAHLSVASAVLQVTDNGFTFAPERRDLLKSILQFQMGAEGNEVSLAIRSQPWSDVHGYYAFAGEACPEFIASGLPSAKSPGSLVEHSDTRLITKARTEGGEKIFVSVRRERDPRLRAAALSLYGFDCMACGFNFGQLYGDIGEGFIEVHHVVPLSESGRTETNPETDLIVLCSNCHRIIHRRQGICLSLDELKRHIRR